jgi:undecaprenyl-diphosphatase
MIGYIQTIDTRTFLSLFKARCHPSIVKTALVVSTTADGWFYLLLLPLIIVLKPGEAGHYLLLVLTALTMERLVYYVLKNSIRRRRPPAALQGFCCLVKPPDEFSLPSGHTSAAFLVVTFLCYGLDLLFLPLYLWAAAVGASRVVLGVHFPTDVLVGALIGTSITLLVL